MNLGPTALWLASATLAILGAYFLRRGWWPCRLGDAPHCKSCGYNVTGLSSPQCPECGSPVADGVVMGLRQRRPYLALCGLTAMAIGLLIAGVSVEQQWIHQIDWYHYRPFTRLIEDLDRRNDITAMFRACEELQRRRDAGLLDAAQYNALIERLLAEQVTATPSFATSQMLELLEREAFAGRLTDAQRLRYVTEATRGELIVQPTPWSPKRYGTFRVANAGRKTDISWLQMWHVRVTVDDHAIPNGQNEHTGWGLTTLSHSGDVPPLPPGKHRVRAVIDISVGSDEVHLFGNEEQQPPIQILTVDIDIPGPAAPTPSTQTSHSP